MSNASKSTTAMNRDIRAMVQDTFDSIGGMERLADWAKKPENLTTFYTQIWGKTIPKDVKAELGGEGGGPVKLVIEWQKPE